LSRRIGRVEVPEWLADPIGKGAEPGEKGGCRHCVGNSESISKIIKRAGLAKLDRCISGKIAQ